MGRRDDWIDMAARSPWPVGIVVGVAVCAFFNWGIPMILIWFGGPFGRQLGESLWKVQTGYVGYAILAMCWLGSLVSFIRQRKRMRTSAKVASGSPGFSALVTESEPRCTRCGEAMVMRTARASGERFWGCSTFPKCRGTLPIAN